MIIKIHNTRFHDIISIVIVTVYGAASGI